MKLRGTILLGETYYWRNGDSKIDVKVLARNSNGSWEIEVLQSNSKMARWAVGNRPKTKFDDPHWYTRLNDAE